MLFGICPCKINWFVLFSSFLFKFNKWSFLNIFQVVTCVFLLLWTQYYPPKWTPLGRLDHRAFTWSMRLKIVASDSHFCRSPVPDKLKSVLSSQIGLFLSGLAVWLICYPSADTAHVKIHSLKGQYSRCNRMTSAYQHLLIVSTSKQVL